MTLRQFRKFNKEDQALTIWEGAYIGSRKDREHDIRLFQIDGFYVEVFYHRDYKVLRMFRSFSNIRELTPYLNKIQLPGFG